MGKLCKYACKLGWVVVLAAAQPAWPQTDEAASGGWRKFGEPRAVGQAPAELIVPTGTWIKVRVDQPLSSDRNRQGDQFTATLEQPLVVDGLVVARRGQTVAGRVTSVEKAGRVKGTSALGIELTEVSLADGRQLPIRSQLIEYRGPTSGGRDAVAIAGTTATGAAIGGAVEGGFGAGVGALAGAAAAAIGVLATRGRPTEVYPESVLTFRTVEPLAIPTVQTAFRPVQPEDYEETVPRRVSLPAPSYPPAYDRYYPYAWAGPLAWGYPPFPYWYGPSVSFYFGPGFYGWPGAYGWYGGYRFRGHYYRGHGKHHH